MSIKIQQAKVEDAPFLAKMILQSSRAGKKDSLFDLIFETNDDAVLLEKLEKLTQTQAKSQCHYKNFLIATLDGKPVGTLCSYEPRIATQETFIEALHEVGCKDEVEATLDIVYECNFDTNKRTLMFDYLEELEGFVDVGVLKALMQKSLLNARLKGYRIAQTMIEIGSLESELFYKKMGFSKVASHECTEYKEVFGRSGLMLFSMEF
ncbi:acyl-CoA acyltransferase [Sulfurimonas sp.]|uniref:acyl-CoA acyltransferase n=1 Tax=Sulfurimonas sp. TaxID=2022749 RepID=UPI0026237416|nr:acyl-CoA acyltransferase [Sulfurimonas sp.]